MTDKDPIYAKISIIKNCLQRFKQATGLNPEILADYDKQDIFILNLQRAIQATIDIANLIISSEGFGMPDSYRASFKILKDNGWIDEKTSQLMQKMIGFCNISIHDYQAVDLEILKSILKKNLSDFEKFYKQIVHKIDSREKPDK